MFAFPRWLQRRRFVIGLPPLGLLSLALALWPQHGRSNVEWASQGIVPIAGQLPSYVHIEKGPRNRFRYIVNGQSELFIGMGYNPIYRDLSDEQRAANYRRDFKLLCEAGVNHITGWDRDKGYDQDKFDELTLDTANHYGIGVLMPIYLPPDADYRDDETLEHLKTEVRQKVERFRNHPALRMWGLGNEVLSELPGGMRRAFGRVYLEIADLVHALDLNHPVIYREAEVLFVPAIKLALENSEVARPWLLYGMNIYSMELERILGRRPDLSDVASEEAPKGYEKFISEYFKKLSYEK